jgi:hypothetical protein
LEVAGGLSKISLQELEHVDFEPAFLEQGLLELLDAFLQKSDALTQFGVLIFFLFLRLGVVFLAQLAMFVGPPAVNLARYVQSEAVSRSRGDHDSCAYFNLGRHQAAQDLVPQA